jgi:hypothetical protein
MKLLAAAVLTICVSQFPVARSAELSTTQQVVIWAEPTSLGGRTDVVKAATVLSGEVRVRSLFPGIHAECVAYELEAIDRGQYDFAIKFNQRKCGGESASNLLDRARVLPKRDEVLWWNSDGNYVPFKNRHQN